MLFFAVFIAIPLFSGEWGFSQYHVPRRDEEQRQPDRHPAEPRARFFGGKRNASQERETGPEKVSAGDESRKEAIRRIPWNSLSKDARAKANNVIKNDTLFRCLPEQAVYCKPEVYQYLLLHPDIVVAFWEKMGVTQVSLHEIGPDKYRLKENAGTTAVVEVLYRTPTLTIAYAKGFYRGPLLARPIEGEALLVLKSRFMRDKDEEPLVAVHLNAFITIRNVGAEILAKLLFGVMGKIADANFEQTIGFVGSVSATTTSAASPVPLFVTVMV